MTATPLRGTESQPHAAAVLGPALPPHGEPSHAYLFHGPRGSGMRAAASAFAAALLSDGASLDVAREDGAREDDARRDGAGEDDGREDGAGRDGAGVHVAQRVQRGTHPDLTWVTPTGAAEMLVADVDEPVVAAATRTPFEASRRVFVIEDADKMNERAANGLLKTLEEPPHFAYLILLASRLQDVLPTIVSRCQLVRFDPLPPAAIERQLLEGDRDGDAEVSAGGRPLPASVAAACARLALGDAELALRLTGPEGAQLRAACRALVAAVFDQRLAVAKPWSALLDAAGSAGERAAEQVIATVAAELQLLPSKERRRREREGAEAARRAQRRQRTRALDLGLRLIELWLRDMLCLAEGVGELVHAKDAIEALEADLVALQAQGASPKALSGAVELVARTRLDLTQNVSEELALEALSYRLQSAMRPRSGARS